MPRPDSVIMSQRAPASPSRVPAAGTSNPWWIGLMDHEPRQHRPTHTLGWANGAMGNGGLVDVDLHDLKAHNYPPGAGFLEVVWGKEAVRNALHIVLWTIGGFSRS